MSFQIELKINGRTIGNAYALNLGPEPGRGTVRDYSVSASARENQMLGQEAWSDVFILRDHDRNQSPWALVELIAKEILNRQQERANG